MSLTYYTLERRRSNRHHWKELVGGTEYENVLLAFNTFFTTSNECNPLPTDQIRLLEYCKCRSDCNAHSLVLIKAGENNPTQVVRKIERSSN